MKSKIFNLKFLISLTILVLIAVVTIILLVNHSQTANVAKIYVNNVLVETLDLKEDKTVEIKTENGYNIVCVKNKKVFVSEADCLNNDCVFMGKMDKINQTIICLPHKMVIELKREAVGK